MELLLLFYPPGLISANVLEQEKRIRKLSGFRQHNNLQRQIGDRPANGAITILSSVEVLQNFAQLIRGRLTYTTQLHSIDPSILLSNKYAIKSSGNRRGTRARRNGPTPTKSQTEMDE